MTKVREVVVLTTGGTIDKEYPRGTGGYAFEFGKETAAHRIQEMLFIFITDPNIYIYLKQTSQE